MRKCIEIGERLSIPVYITFLVFQCHFDQIENWQCKYCHLNGPEGVEAEGKKNDRTALVLVGLFWHRGGLFMNRISSNPII